MNDDFLTRCYSASLADDPEPVPHSELERHPLEFGERETVRIDPQWPDCCTMRMPHELDRDTEYQKLYQRKKMSLIRVRTRKPRVNRLVRDGVML